MLAGYQYFIAQGLRKMTQHRCTDGPTAHADLQALTPTGGKVHNDQTLRFREHGLELIQIFNVFDGAHGMCGLFLLSDVLC